MVSLKEKLEMDFPGLFDKESELAQKKRDTWDRFTYPESSKDPKNRSVVEFMVYVPFEERQGTLTDKNGNILPLYALKVINLDGLRKQTIMAGESVVRSLVADVINNDILLDDEMTKLSGLVYGVETIPLKDKVFNEMTKEWEQKKFHKFSLDIMKSIPEENRNRDGVEKYLTHMEKRIKEKREQEKKDKEAKEKGTSTQAQIDSQETFGKFRSPNDHVMTEVPTTSTGTPPLTNN